MRAAPSSIVAACPLKSRSEAGIRRVTEGFARVMPDPSYLCIGASESLLRVTSRFELTELSGAFVYLKHR